MADQKKIAEDRRRVLDLINRDEVVKIACDLVDIPSPTGSEKQIADYIIDRYRRAGLKVLPQVFEDGRANAIGIIKGKGGGPTLMLNGHMDTSFVGNLTGPEEFMPDLPGYRPKAVIDDDWIYGLGVYNMKASLAAFIHVAEAIKRAGVELEGDVVIACVAGEIEKAQVDRSGAAIPRRRLRHLVRHHAWSGRRPCGRRRAVGPDARPCPWRLRLDQDHAVWTSDAQRLQQS